MAVTMIPNVTNWSVTPQNGQVGYFTLMNTWLSESTAVIASLHSSIVAQNTANGEINALAIQVADNATDAQNARDEAVSAIAVLASGVIDDTTIAINKAYSNQKTNELLNLKLDKDFSLLMDKSTPIDTDIVLIGDSASSNISKKVTFANLKSYTSPSSSETVSGIIELATTVEAQAGTDDSKAITPLKLRNALNATGTAPIYANRAKVVFNGTGTVAIESSGNISSVTDLGVGNYRINTTVQLPANFGITASCARMASAVAQPIYVNYLNKLSNSVDVYLTYADRTLFVDSNDVSVILG